MRLESVIAGTRAEARPYQFRIINKCVQYFRGTYVDEHGRKQEEPLDSIMIESPTGSGKSVMALLTLKMMQLHEPNTHIAWVAMRRNLLSQIKREADRMGIGLQNFHVVSMFDKYPESVIAAKRAGHKVIMNIDECLDGATLLTVIHDGRECLATIRDVVEHGVGSHVLSYDVETGVCSYELITSRTNTGVREVYEVVVEVGGEQITIVATGNHLVFADGEYVRVDELVAGQEVVVGNYAVERSNTQELQHDDQETAVPTTH